jgi:excisionase family DNA binding protein
MSLSQADIVEIEKLVANLMALHRDTWLSPSDAASALDCHVNTVGNLCKAGKLVFNGEGRARRISRASINKLMAADGDGIAVAA